MDDNRGLVVLLILIALFAFGGDGGVISSKGEALTIVYESAEQTPEMANLFVQLRNGEAEKKLSGKLLILDKDTTDHLNKPLPVLEKFKPFACPELLVTNKDRTTLKSRKPLPKTVDEVVKEVE